MTPQEYRDTLTRATDKLSYGRTDMSEDDPVLTLVVPKVTGLGARGTLLCHGQYGPVRSFTRAECRRMLTRLAAAEKETWRG